MYLFLGLFFVFSANVHAEVIKTFDSHVVVNTDSSVSVTETILYDSEGVVKHGIYRDITPVSSQGKRMTIKDVSIVDQAGVAYKWQRENNNADIRFKIGDPNTTFQGVKTYVIHYSATNAVAHLSDTDEIYWNATGNNWPFAIEQAVGVVSLPDGLSVLQQACYEGSSGATNPCTIRGELFSSTRTLAAGEGMTVAVGFPKGIVSAPVLTTKDKVIELVGTFWPVLLPILAFIYMFQKWYRKGRDAKGRGIIIPQYEVVDSLTPLEAAVIINQKIAPRDLVAEILYLATKGYILITQTEIKGFLSKKNDYTLRLQKLPSGELSLADKEILTTLFSKGGSATLQVRYRSFLKRSYSEKENPSTASLILGTEVSLSQRAQFTGLIDMIELQIRQYLVHTQYYTKDFAKKKNLFLYAIPLIILYIILKFFDIGSLLNTIASIGADVTVLYLFVSVFICFCLIKGFNEVMPAKTTKGAFAREHLLGLKEYIKVAEKDRIDFHNAPEKNPQLFEQLLPYAIMFGQEKKWAKAFESITMTAPSWYRGDAHNFAAVAFVSSLHNDFSSSLFTSMGSVGGSGGGGSSGGGGGGGGGGSW